MALAATFAFPCLLFSCVAIPANAQVAGFNPADYGKAQIPTKQSTGDAARFIEASKGAFEPINELDATDPIVAMSRPIGRIDVVLKDKKTGEEIGTSCTGALLANGRVLTNHHCLPVEGQFEPIKASILMDYLTLDGKDSKRFELTPKPEEWSATLDYAITKVEGDPAATFGSVAFRPAEATPGQSLMVIHHPLGKPKVMSRFRCLALKEQAEGAELRHRCDTLGGSSGSLLFNAKGEIVALHKEGGLDAADASSFNTATRIGPILAESKDLQAVALPAEAGTAGAGKQAQQQPAKTDQPATGLDTKQMNDILKGN